jgi:hypothetical protein
VAAGDFAVSVVVHNQKGLKTDVAALYIKTFQIVKPRGEGSGAAGRFAILLQPQPRGASIPCAVC